MASNGKKRFGLRKADVVLFLSITLLAAVLFLFFVIRDARRTDAVLEVSVRGEVVGRYPLSEDRVIEIGGNTAEIKDGKVRMTEADCPDKSCVHTAPVGKDGGVIICLPNRIVLRITGTGEEGVDAVAD